MGTGPVDFTHFKGRENKGFLDYRIQADAQEFFSADKVADHAATIAKEINTVHVLLLDV